MADGPATFTTLITAFTTFLTVAIHTILYERSIYPRTSFLSARKYNHAVRQSRHPKVCQWIADAVAAVESELLKGTVGRVAVVIFDQSEKPLERFMFDCSRLPVVPAGEWDTPLVRESKNGERTDILPLVDLEEQLRAAMAKLTVCGTLLRPVPENCSFTVAIELKDEGDAPIGHPQPWVPVSPGLQKSVHKDAESRGRTGEDVGGVRTTPLRNVEAGEMMFEMWIEEGKTKMRGPEKNGNVVKLGEGWRSSASS
ncbi:hypothetical protein LTR66_010317, partial [Elasticomyces elasticus]